MHVTGVVDKFLLLLCSAELIHSICPHVQVKLFVKSQQCNYSPIHSHCISRIVIQNINQQKRDSIYSAASAVTDCSSFSYNDSSLTANQSIPLSLKEDHAANLSTYKHIGRFEISNLHSTGTTRDLA